LCNPNASPIAQVSRGLEILVKKLNDPISDEFRVVGRKFVQDGTVPILKCMLVATGNCPHFVKCRINADCLQRALHLNDLMGRHPRVEFTVDKEHRFDVGRRHQCYR